MGRHSKAVKLVGGVRGGLALLDDDECRRAIEAGERDIDDGGGFFRGMARPGTALMVAYVDEFRDRFRVGIGRGRVTSVVREPGIRGVRRGGMPVTARPARGAGGGPGLVERGFEAGSPNRPHRSSGCRTPERTEPGITRTKRRKLPHYKSGTKTGHINVPDGTFAPPLVRLCGPVVSACRRTAPGRSRRRTRGSQPDARPSATASGRSSSG